jgi:hypothetical protein
MVRPQLERQIDPIARELRGICRKRCFFELCLDAGAQFLARRFLEQDTPGRHVATLVDTDSDE